MQTIRTYQLSEIIALRGIQKTELFLKNQFHCKRNSDVESFLHNKAIRFHQADAARTFLIFDEQFRISAYFSLTFKIIEFSQISNSLSKKLSGGLNENDATKVFLIGQIGKNDIANNPISLEDILGYAIKYIKQASYLISGRVIILECENNPKLISLYEKYGFKLIETKDDKTLKTMFIIPEFNQ